MKLYTKVVSVVLLLSSSLGFSTDIFRAIEQKDKKVIKQWLKESSDLNVVNDQEQTVLMQAVISGNKQLVKKLLKKGAEVNVVDNVGKAALDYVVEYKQSNVVLRLCKKGAEIALKENQQELSRLKRIARAKKAAAITGGCVPIIVPLIGFAVCGLSFLLLLPGQPF